MPQIKLLAVDVCGTLYRANTTADYVRFGLAALNKKRWLALLLILSSRTLPFRALLIGISKLIGVDVLKGLHVRALSGAPKAQLKELAVTYVQQLDSLRIDAAFHKVKSLQAIGWHVVLVSNSIDVVIEQIADSLQVPFIASTLAFEGERCSGGIAHDLRGRKLSALKQFIGQSSWPSQLGIITDNKSDIDIVEASQLVVLVCAPNGQNWSGRSDAEIIYK